VFMGFLNRDEDNETGNGRKSQVEEVSINVPEEEDKSDNSSLRNEAEKKFSRSSSSSNSSSNKVSLEDVHRQNEKIISMLEDLQEDEENNNTDVGGAMDGVL